MNYCCLCGAVIEIDPDDSILLPGGKSYCSKCAPLVRPGLYAVPGGVSYKALDLLASFRELPPHVRDRLVFCFGPQTWVDIRKEVESRQLVQLAYQATEQLPDSAVARFNGHCCYIVLDYGTCALFIRLDTPLRGHIIHCQDKPVEHEQGADVNSRVLRRLRQSDRTRLIRARIVMPHNDTAQERKKVERAWADHLNIGQSKKDSNEPIPL